MRGVFSEWLTKASQARRNMPGQDLNRGQQGVAGFQGRQNHTATQAPLYTIGGRLQNAIRNRATEQGGLAKAATPTPPSMVPAPYIRGGGGFGSRRY